MTVIVPLDGSSGSEQSIPFARLVAERHGAAMTLVSVVEISTEFDAWIDTAPFTLEDYLDDWLDERQAYLDELVARAGSRATAVVRVGRPAAETMAVVDESEDPIIVMASHGRGGIQQFVLGSVALQVVHDAHDPVIVVRMRDDGAASASVLERVLLPLDGSDFSEQVIERSLSIAGEPKPALHLLRVLETPGWASAPFDAGLVGQYIEASREEARETLAAEAARLEGQGYSVTWEVRDGSPGTEILAVAAERGASLIAMATHGRGGIGRLLLGSVAQRVLNGASVPLLLIRPDAG
jgi:nucleotide-binding universal stress UspA family protein